MTRYAIYLAIVIAAISAGGALLGKAAVTGVTAAGSVHMANVDRAAALQ